jgi:hypothetical protein
MAAGLPVLQQSFRFFEGTWNYMGSDQFTDTSRGCRSCFGRGLDGSNIASNQHCDVTVEKILTPDQNDVRSLYHGVSSLDSANQTARFDHSEGFHEVANLPESHPKSN